MDARGIAARISDLPPLGRRVLIGALLLATFAVSWGSVSVQSPDLQIALWWPAAGVGFLTVLASRGRRIMVSVFLAALITVANLLGDRPLALALAYGIANAVELWIVVRLLTRGRAHAQFTTLPQIGWFLVSVSVGAGVFAMLAGGAASVVTGADPLISAFSLLTSHGSALFVIGPLALVPLTIPLRVPRWEPVVQSTALVGLTVVVFAPAQTLALTFLILPVLMWAGYRLPPLLFAIQTLGLAIAATVATSIELGPFAVLLENDQRGATIALQLFLMTHAATGLFASGQSADSQVNARALAERGRDAVKVAAELLHLTRQKDDFIASVSHELRTPVTSILGFAEQLTEAGLDAESRQVSRIIYRNARRLSDVIEDVLELSELTTSDRSTRPAVELDARLLLSHCVEDTTGLIPPGRDVTVDLRLPEYPVLFRGVEQDLSRVCSNLLSNAIKFSPAGGTVRVTLTELADSLELSIADDGPGVPIAEQDAVWDRFYRVQTPQHRDVPGTGLGLPIVRALVRQRIGGDVTLHSDGEHGTTMVVRVPRTATATQRSVRAPDQPSTS